MKSQKGCLYRLPSLVDKVSPHGVNVHHLVVVLLQKDNHEHGGNYDYYAHDDNDVDPDDTDYIHDGSQDMYLPKSRS